MIPVVGGGGKKERYEQNRQGKGSAGENVSKKEGETSSKKRKCITGPDIIDVGVYSYRVVN